MAVQLILNKPLKMGKEVFTILSNNNDALVFNYSLDPGGAVPQHVHHHSDEIFEMTEGTLTVYLKDERRELKAGEILTVPVNGLHGLKNRTSKTISCRVTYTPRADADKVIACMQQLAIDYPNDVIKNQMKAFYISKKLRWRDFSSPGNTGGVVVFAIIGLFVTIGGALGGWNKLLAQFR